MSSDTPLSPVRTRFAPSPTGFLHLGSARTALFNWAYARRHGGVFALRIEDTDHERSTRESERGLLDGLEWLGLEWDEGPVRQSERRVQHQAAIAELLGKGRAYRCVCTREELELRRHATIADGGKWTYDGRCRDADHGPECGEHTVRLRLESEGRIEWDDLVHGPTGQDVRELGDRIIQRSDGGSLYNLAVVVDDRDMQISHVIRGDDHQINTALQIAIYRALDVDPPVFAHVPLIVGEGGKKLSKRRDPVSVQKYRDEGYLADALRNWLVRMGWSHGDDEIFSRDEIAELFDLDAVGHSSAQVNFGKLQWLNQHYIGELDAHALYTAVAPHLEAAAGSAVQRSAALDRLLDLLRERSRTLSEMAAQARWLLVDEIEIEEKAAKKHLKPAAAPILRALGAALGGIDAWNEASIETTFHAVQDELDGIGMGKLAQPTRVAVTGSAASPGIYETLACIAQARALARIASAAALADARAGD